MADFDLMAFAGGESAEGNLTNMDMTGIQAGLWRLLAARTERYTMGDSSSVPVETAQELLTSICFTLGLYLKENGGSLQMLAESDLNELLGAGFKILEERLELGKRLWQAACLTAPEIENISCRDTLQGIGSFFRRYDYRFFAHQIPCDIDYQLSQPVPDTLLGIEYLNEYLRRILIENHFLRRFDRKLVIRLLTSFCPDYKGLLINLYEPAAVNALGLALIGGDPFLLDIDDAGRARLAALLTPLPERTVRSALKRAAEVLCRALDIRDAAAQHYLTRTAENLYPRIAARCRPVIWTVSFSPLPPIQAPASETSS